ncbi:M48 family metallopeptidase [Candidatus Albibeggiatoa sp. nov. NOAA]|uniref:M48 family metallopeptidase n=1 Tax=Candidatus Albibeggiatoa sp. nov. NOAA TaxID=3162724 RepID=UPI00330122B8|nr:M48 family metallopeptidase [Thiotrichaceae bacterium]
MWKKITLILVAGLIVSCATTPLGRKQLAFMPAEQMDVMGVQAFQTIKDETPAAPNSKVNSYVQCVTNALLSTLQDSEGWEIVVFEDEAVNAFALPGRKIGVYTGLLNVAENQHQLAAVVGHEIAHVLSNHGNERVSQQMLVQTGMEVAQAIFSNPESQTAQVALGALGLGTQFGILLPFSRKHETEADELGLQIMARAGFQPQESVNLWVNMGKGSEGAPPEFMSTHPSHETRINDLQSQMHYAQQLYQQSTSRPNCR